MAEPQLGVAFTFTLALVDRANRPQFRVNPTLATGDFQISKDGGALGNLATLPVVAPAGSILVDVALSAAEMTFTNYATVVAKDAAGAEWDDAVITIAPSAGTLQVDVTRIGDNAEGGTRLARSTRAIVLATVGVGSTTTSIVTSTMNPAATVTDQFKGQIVSFDQNTLTAALRGQKTDVTASTSGGVLTVTALTTAPVSGDTFTLT